MRLVSVLIAELKLIVKAKECNSSGGGEEDVF